MKSSRAQKRKITESAGKWADHIAVSVKKSANGTGKVNLKALGVPAGLDFGILENIKRPQVEPCVQLQVPSAKIKLQLFPIDEVTQRGLEKDGYNPFLELTLSARKKISSVVRHLTTKWGTSSIAIGQLVLFPHNTKKEQSDSCRRWTLSDSAITTREVYAAVGHPSIFRLRYGWLSNVQQKFVHHMPPKSAPRGILKDLNYRNDFLGVLEIANHRNKNSDEVTEAIPEHSGAIEVSHLGINELKVLDAPTKLVDKPETTDTAPVNSTLPWDDGLTNLSIGGLLSDISMQEKISISNLNPENESCMKLMSENSISRLFSEASLLGKFGADNTAMRSENESPLQPLLLPPSDASIGGLLSEASLQGKVGENLAGSDNIKPAFNSFGTNQTHFHDTMLQNPSCHEATLSILDSDETCHAFAFRQPRHGRG